MLEKGSKIGDYTLLDFVGSGGFADVWRAEKRTALDKNDFALKFFRPKSDGLEFDKIDKEIRVWKQLKGLPHIISITELDQFEDYVYVVSDFAKGGSLEKYLRKNNGKAKSIEEAVQITIEILTGLENLHEKGFVHRDLKPDNILIMNGKHCLADFSVSRKMKSHSKATGTAGTFEYMPPEAFDKKPLISAETDIWAIGVILQRLLTGKLPYPQDDQPSLIAAILMSEPERASDKYPKHLRSIINKALQKERTNRFQSAKEMRAALEKPQTNIEISQSKYMEPRPPQRNTALLNKEEIQKIEKVEEEKSIQISLTSSEKDSFRKSSFDKLWENNNSVKTDGESKRDRAFYYNARGLVYEDKGLFTKAIKYYSRAIKLEPECFFYINRARVHKLQGNIELAGIDYRKALKANLNLELNKSNPNLEQAIKAMQEKGIKGMKQYIFETEKQTENLEQITVS